MARRRYYRRAIRVVPRKKWATFMKTGMITDGGSGTGSVTRVNYHDILAANSADNAVPTPVIVKTGNFKIQGDCYIAATNPIITSLSVTLYVMYIPQAVYSAGSVALTNAISDHPEWIMAWKVVDTNVATTSANSYAFSFSSRLKRNLNSGDLILLIVDVNGGSSNLNLSQIRVKYTAQYWTCAN